MVTRADALIQQKRADLVADICVTGFGLIKAANIKESSGILIPILRGPTLKPIVY